MNTKITTLFTKYYHNFCSQEELDQVMMILRAGKYPDEWEAMLKDEAIQVMERNPEAEMPLAEMGALNQRILMSLKPKPSTTVKLFQKKYWQRIISAAAVILVVSAGIYFYSNSLANKNPVEFVNTPDIIPAGNGATLTLANGKKINLSDAANGQLAEEAGVGITKTADGQIVYESKNAHSKSNNMNALSTEKGQIYQLCLPDGTKVWLNAASTLEYPASFKGREDRRILLRGEAYFEVKRDAYHPFVVESNGQQVEVLGTHFNINSYSDESVTKTTLLEGSVRVANLVAHRSSEMILKPGQQSALSSTGKLKVQAADLDLALAWKNNEFMFESGSIEDVMREIARWYDVEIIYTGEKPIEKFVGSISRSHKISKVLQLLASTGGVHFKIEGQKVYVSK